MTNSKKIQEGGVDEYIAKSPTDAREGLRKIRCAIREVAPGATETTSYFQIPGYSYDGYEYNGMFAWFSFKPTFIRLHVIPPVIENHKEQLSSFTTTKSVVNFPITKELPIALIKELVKASIKVMKNNPK